MTPKQRLEARGRCADVREGPWKADAPGRVFVRAPCKRSTQVHLPGGDHYWVHNESILEVFPRDHESGMMAGEPLSNYKVPFEKAKRVAEFVASARTDLPAALDELERYDKEVGRALFQIEDGDVAGAVRRLRGINPYPNRMKLGGEGS